MRPSRCPLMLLPLVLASVVLTGCTASDGPPDGESTSGALSPDVTAPAPSGPPTMTPSPSARTTPSPTRTHRPHSEDPRWVFFTTDRKRYRSAWFPGRHRVMIGFGCTAAPYYSPDSSCPDGQGFHHGVDVAIPCGTPLHAGRRATVLPHDVLGPAYGDNPVLLRVGGLDVVIGHTRQVYVDVGDRVAQGERFARVSDAGAPDGCHLHFEVRRPGGGVSEAVDPAALLRLAPPRGRR